MISKTMKPTKFTKLGPVYVLLPAIIAGGALIRIYQIGRLSLWYDELYMVWAAKLPLSKMAVELPASSHPLFYFLLGHFWFPLGSSEAWVRMVSFAAGVTTIGLVYLIGRELFNRRVGLWASAFAAAAPLLVWYSRDATDYGMAIATSMASVYFLVRCARRGGGRNWAGYVVATMLALFTHYYAVALLAGEIPFFLLVNEGGRTRLKSWLLSEGTVAVLIVPWALLNQGTSKWISIQWPSLHWLFEALGAAPALFIGGYVREMGSGSAVLSVHGKEAASLALLLLIVGLILAWKPLRRAVALRKVAALWVLMFIVIILPTLSQLVSGSFVAGRFLVLAAPLFVVFLASVVAMAPLRIGALAGAVMLVALLGLSAGQLRWTQNDDWRGIMRTIAGKSEASDTVLCFPLHDCVQADYFYPVGPLSFRGGHSAGPSGLNLFVSFPAWRGYSSPPGQSKRLEGSELVSELDRQLAGSQRVWLVEGTGMFGNLPKAEAAEEALSGRWDLVQIWQDGTLQLKLYQRRGPQGTAKS